MNANVSQGAHAAPDQPGEGASVAGALKRNAPLVPTDSAASRALVAVVAILTFLAALCAGAADLVAANSAAWQASIAREATVQVRPLPQRDIEADVARAADLARASPGVTEVHVVSKADGERLLEPWLGSGLDLGGLPVPRLIALKLREGGPPDLAGLRQALRSEVPTATLDDHAAWVSRLTAMANTLVGLSLAVVALVLAATGLAVAFATRGAMAGNREVVDVLHVVGAGDDFIAREFQRRFFRLGLRGGVIGGVATLALVALFGVLMRVWRASPAGDQIEALFGDLAVGWRGVAGVVLIVVVVALVTGLASRLTVRRFLREPG